MNWFGIKRIERWYPLLVAILMEDGYWSDLMFESRKVAELLRRLVKRDYMSLLSCVADLVNKWVLLCYVLWQLLIYNSFFILLKSLKIRLPLFSSLFLLFLVPFVYFVLLQIIVNRCLLKRQILLILRDSWLAQG